jgi:hypothetical protein
MARTVYVSIEVLGSNNLSYSDNPQNSLFLEQNNTAKPNPSLVDSVFSNVKGR